MDELEKCLIKILKNEKTLLTFLSAIIYLPLCTLSVAKHNIHGVLGLDAEAYDFVNESGDSLTALPHANVGDYTTFLTLECLQIL